MLIIKYENGVTVDDLVSENCTVHLERTDTKHWWMAIYDQAGNEAHVEFFDCTNVLVTLNRATEQRNEAEAGAVELPEKERSK